MQKPCKICSRACGMMDSPGIKVPSRNEAFVIPSRIFAEAAELVNERENICVRECSPRDKNSCKLIIEIVYHLIFYKILNLNYKNKWTNLF